MQRKVREVEISKECGRLLVTLKGVEKQSMMVKGR